MSVCTNSWTGAGGLQSIPAEKNLGKADPRTTARTVGSWLILSNTWPSSVQNLHTAMSMYAPQCRCGGFDNPKARIRVYTYGSWKAFTGFLHKRIVQFLPAATSQKHCSDLPRQLYVSYILCWCRHFDKGGRQMVV